MGNGGQIPTGYLTTSNHLFDTSEKFYGCIQIGYDLDMDDIIEMPSDDDSKDDRRRERLDVGERQVNARTHSDDSRTHRRCHVWT